jgi:hypothetical protein
MSSGNRVFQIKLDGGGINFITTDESMETVANGIAAQNRRAGRTFEMHDTGAGIRFEMTYPQIGRTVTGVIKRSMRAEADPAFKYEKRLARGRERYRENKAHIEATRGVALHG